MRKFIIASIISATLFSCKEAQKPSQVETEPTVEPANSEWIDLFDGTSTDAWKGWKKDKIGAAWSIQENGDLMFDPTVEDKGDIITRESFENLVRWLEEMKENAYSKMQVILVGNKVDLENE